VEVHFISTEKKQDFFVKASDEVQEIFKGFF